MTAAYLVRIAEGHEFVGFFVVDKFDDLYTVLDEFLNPDLCEVSRLQTPGGVFFNEGAPPIPPTSFEDDPLAEWREEIGKHPWMESEHWWLAEEDRKWERLKR